MCRQGINSYVAFGILRASESHSLICVFLFNNADTDFCLERGLSVPSTTGKSNHLNSLAGSVLMSCLKRAEEVESGKCYFSSPVGLLMAVRHLHNH